MVAAPDPRLGEHALRVRAHAAGPGARPTSTPCRAHLDARRPREAEVAGGDPPDRRVPAHAVGQDPEVRPAPAPPRRGLTPRGHGAEVAAGELGACLTCRTAPDQPAPAHDHGLLGELEGTLHVLLDEQDRHALGARCVAASRTRGRRACGASPSDISSAIRSRGGAASTRARLSICCSPPDSVPARCLRRSPSTGNVSSARSRRRRRARHAARRIAGAP